MKRAWAVLVLAVLVSAAAFGQFKPKGDMRSGSGDSMVRSEDSGLLFGWFDPNRLFVHNSYSLSYTSFGGRGFSLGTLTSSVMYKFSDPLSVQFDVSLVHSPFNNFGGKFGQDISGIYLTRAQLDYKVSDNTRFQIQYRQLPSMYWLNNYRPNDFFGPLPDEEFPR